ncbi:hypothetical protein [Nocardioides acrostichi]|uniref:Ig-like domain-containing protein n=1 Tax=Nocardioides acrostichi TaxID=2784339 RepID=A0A930UY42_9ACTN|nr:hypothetical protein [Nocardioides acrostichi]MBF4161200.1 hypothetical protein [Nocardioides acrostichi]
MTLRAPVVLAALALCLVLAPVRGSLASWTDSGSVTSGTLSARTLQSVPLSCTGGGASVTISWTPSTSPATLTYTAKTSQSATALPVTGNSSTTVTTTLLVGLLGALLGSTVTVVVTGSLPGTLWVTTQQITLRYTPIILGAGGLTCP